MQRSKMRELLDHLVGGASNEGGMAIPSALAVLRLMIT